LIHLVVNHFVAEGGLLTYADVVAYYRIPIIPIMEIAFLIIVVSHALIGLRSIILDLRPSRQTLTAINWLFVVIGIVSVVYGIWLIQVIVAKGSA
jgi:succinate dehydrogenase / fumarate reductase membrane anchor subunit